MKLSIKPFRLSGLVLCLIACWHLSIPSAIGSGPIPSGDPHYSEAGFFDMHVCNWPDKPTFLMLIFSTTQFKEVARIDVHFPDGRTLHTFDLSRYKIIRRDGKPEKRVFINEVKVPANAANGWYPARITMMNGAVHTAQDFLIVSELGRAQVVSPLPDAKDLPLPVTLRWQAVPGAQYYRIFIRDVWNDEKMIYHSDLLASPQLRIPDGILEPGGVYNWRVHARDVNEHPLLGDFNHGSQNKAVLFSISE